MTESSEKSAEETPASQAPEGATLEKHGKGYLVLGGGVSANAMGFRQVAPGICPKCETAASEWVPPTGDFRYMNRIQALKEVHSLATDLEAHNLHLKQQGGFICECTCGTSFWVPSTAAKVKE